MLPQALLLLSLSAGIFAQDGSISGPTSSSSAAGYSCDASKCKLPDCNCASTDPPGGLDPVSLLPSVVSSGRPSPPPFASKSFGCAIVCGHTLCAQQVAPTLLWALSAAHIAFIRLQPITVPETARENASLATSYHRPCKHYCGHPVYMRTRYWELRRVLPVRYISCGRRDPPSSSGQHVIIGHACSSTIVLESHAGLIAGEPQGDRSWAAHMRIESTC